MKYLIFLFMIVFVVQVDEIRAEGVRARYLENGGLTTVLELTVEDPPPSSVIVKQQLPPGTQIRSASPEYVKFHAGRARVKWLFRRPVAGVVIIKLHYEQPLVGKAATAEIRCKSPSNGKLMTIKIP